jgi:hypothetical protein
MLQNDRMIVTNFQKLEHDGKKWPKHVAVEVIWMSNFLKIMFAITINVDIHWHPLAHPKGVNGLQLP